MKMEPQTKPAMGVWLFAAVRATEGKGSRT